jgi:PhnB protein
MEVQAYLFFEGRCEEAIAFYQSAIGAKVERVMHFKDAPDQSMISPENAGKVMHAHLTIGKTAVLASDGHCTGKSSFGGFGLTLQAPSDSEADRLFSALSDGGQIGMPMAQTFFASRFGMVTDRFGVMWMVMTQAG